MVCNQYLFLLVVLCYVIKYFISIRGFPHVFCEEFFNCLFLLCVAYFFSVVVFFFFVCGRMYLTNYYGHLLLQSIFYSKKCSRK